MKRKPTITQLIRSEQEEAARIRRFLDTDELDDSILWHAPGVPTHAHAVQIAQQMGITRGRVLTRQSQQRNGNGVTLATVQCVHGSVSRIGAAASKDPQVAIELAFRNAVRQLIPQEGVQLVWRKKVIPRPPNGYRRWKHATTDWLLQAYERDARHTEAMRERSIDCMWGSFVLKPKIQNRLQLVPTSRFLYRTHVKWVFRWQWSPT